MEDIDRRLEALDLQVPKAKALPGSSPVHARSTSSKTTSLSPRSEETLPAFASAQPAPRLDTRRLGRNRISRTRREAKSRRYEGANVVTGARAASALERPPPPSTRLELRVHAAPVQDDDEEDQATPFAHKRRQWKRPEGARSRKAMSMPPQRNKFVVVDDEVGDSNTPVCGIDLGPFLSWLSCMPAIPEANEERDA